MGTDFAISLLRNYLLGFQICYFNRAAELVLGTDYLIVIKTADFSSKGKMLYTKRVIVHCGYGEG